jgi:hypothetical protein
MNIFQLSAVVTPLAGAIAGGVSVRTPGLAPAATGIGLGLMISAAVYFAAVSLSALMSRVGGARSKSERLSPAESSAALAAVLAPMASPFAAWALSALVIGRFLHL